MTPSQLLLEAYGRIDSTARAVLEGIDPDVLVWRPDPEANHIAWLVWHVARLQDDHVAAVADRPQLWRTSGWHDRFGLPLDPGDIGYGHTAEQVGQVDVRDPQLLLDYLEAVAAVTRDTLAEVTPADLDRVVDPSYDPPVTLGVRLVSVVDDSLQHLGQAAYLRGLAERTR